MQRSDEPPSAKDPVPSVRKPPLAPPAPSPAVRLTRESLDQSLKLGRTFLLNSQLPNGLFRYHVNFLDGQTAPEQNPVRQAGALWGLALLHQDHPADDTRQAVLRGLAFFRDHSRLTDQGGRFICFPGAAEGDSGSVALVSLAVIDFLRAEPANQHVALSQQLAEYLAFLLSMQRPDRQFHRKYLLTTGEGWGQASPYFDGEILLALVKAARYCGRDDLQPVVLQCADAMFNAHARDTLRENRPDDDTKGFYQWGCMAFAELYDAKWPGTTVCAERTIQLTYWMIDVHRTLERRLNTAYAQEGILSAYHLARQTGDARASAKFRDAVQQGLGKLNTWQVGAEGCNDYLRRHPDFRRECVGGVLGAEDSPWLRIDTTQHQMHAVILARRYLW